MCIRNMPIGYKNAFKYETKNDFMVFKINKLS